MYKNNDLQRAIDEITQNNLASGALDGASEAATTPSLGVDLNAPRVELTPETKVETVVPPMPAATMQGLMNGVEPVAQPLATETVTEVKEEAPSVATTDLAAKVTETAVDVAEIKTAAMKELLPLVDRVEMDDKKRFELCRKMYETLKDKAVLAQALEAARKIADEKERAEALFYLVDMVEE